MLIKLFSKTKAYGICLYQMNENNIRILLCKSINSKKRWGFLKGCSLNRELPMITAQREFLEESGIITYIKDYEEYFEQRNEDKDIGIWLLNANKIPNFHKYFIQDDLKDYFLSMENSEAKFFEVDDLPKIKSKQKDLVKDIIRFLKNKRQYH